MDHRTDLWALLPDGVLADALGRLAPRDLAVSRSVCKAWRDAVDGYGILRTELLPWSLAGILINYNWRSVTEFFARPPKTTKALSAVVSGEHHDFLAEGDIGSWATVLDHCNGLLLIEDYDEDEGYRRALEVFNPAARCYDPVPPCPPRGDEMICAFTDEHLAYDPAVSPHYQVFSIPSFGCREKVVDSDTEAIEQMEWPPATYVLHVFSSVTGRWEERSFVREGEAAGTVADMRQGWSSEHNNAVYRQGELFVHCQTNFVMRISLSNDKYHVIKPPAGIGTMYLGKSGKGIYCASFLSRFVLRVWVLNESCFPMEWVLKHDHDLLGVLKKNKLSSPSRNYDQHARGPWMFQDINYYYGNTDVNPKALVKDEFAWSSDASDDETAECGVDSEDISLHGQYFDILGFHPYKEIIFLSQSITRGFAYHLNSSSIQDLGYLYPKGYEQELPNERSIESSFPYTPCWIELI
ncbi:unnamed protein product [Urochloa humidicola]